MFCWNNLVNFIPVLQHSECTKYFHLILFMSQIQPIPSLSPQSLRWKNPLLYQNLSNPRQWQTEGLDQHPSRQIFQILIYMQMVKGSTCHHHLLFYQLAVLWTHQPTTNVSITNSLVNSSIGELLHSTSSNLFIW